MFVEHPITDKPFKFVHIEFNKTIWKAQEKLWNKPKTARYYFSNIRLHALAGVVCLYMKSIFYGKERT